jgi:hypothetical protein
MNDCLCQVIEASMGTATEEAVAANDDNGDMTD